MPDKPWLQRSSVPGSGQIRWSGVPGTPDSRFLRLQYEVDTSQLKRLCDVLAQVPARGPEVTLDAVNKIVTHIQANVQKHTPVGVTGLLRSNIFRETEVVSQVPVDVVGHVYTDMIYGAAVETGARPRWVPFEPLHLWVMRKLGKSGDDAAKVTSRIRVSISREGTSSPTFTGTGTQGFLMFERGLEDSMPYVDKVLGEAADELMKGV